MALLILCICTFMCAQATLLWLPPFPNPNSNNKACICPMGAALCRGILKFPLTVQKSVHHVSAVPLQSEFVKVVLN